MSENGGLFLELINLKNCSFPITHIAKKLFTQAVGKTFFYLIQTKYYFLFQMLPSLNCSVNLN